MVCQVMHSMSDAEDCNGTRALSAIFRNGLNNLCTGNMSQNHWFLTGTYLGDDYQRGCRATRSIGHHALHMPG